MAKLSKPKQRASDSNNERLKSVASAKRPYNKTILDAAPALGFVKAAGTRKEKKKERIIANGIISNASNTKTLKPQVQPKQQPRITTTQERGILTPSVKKPAINTNGSQERQKVTSALKEKRERPTCKKRPDGNKKRIGPGKTRPHIPWCKKS